MKTVENQIVKKISLHLVSSLAPLVKNLTKVYLKKELTKQEELEIVCMYYVKEKNEFNSLGYLLTDSKTMGLALLKELEVGEVMAFDLITLTMTDTNFIHLEKLNLYIDVTNYDELDDLLNEFNYTKEEFLFSSKKNNLEEIKYLISNNKLIKIEADCHDNAIYITNEYHEILAKYKLDINNRYLLTKINEKTKFNILDIKQSLHDFMSDNFDVNVEILISK